MTKKIVINPLTRISGFLEIEVKVDKEIIEDTTCSGMLFRGFEKMLEGRSPLDAIYFTERICGICSTAHSVAATKALEDALGIKPSKNDQLIRDFIHGCEFLQNHLRHFYLYTFPDFVKGPELNPVYDNQLNDYRLPPKYNKLLSKHYLEAVKYSRLSHKMLAKLAGKAPHNHGIFVGGVTVNLDSSLFVEVKSILTSIKRFIDEIMLEDIDILSKYYEDYYLNGRGYGNFISYGVFDDDYVKPGIYLNQHLKPFKPDLITENIHYSWYKEKEDEIVSDVLKKDAYSFVKAPRYNGFAMETGPLARMYISGLYRKGISTMDRMIARVLETKTIAEIMIRILDQLKLKPTEQDEYQIPKESVGIGLVDTTRGALGHWIKIKDHVIDKYTIITPTAWNLSPKDSKGIKGPMECALLGTQLPKNNVSAIGRIVRSFDPCVSCATHVLTGTKDLSIRVV